MHYRYLTNTNFAPETVAKICEAFEMTVKAMHDCGQPDVVQEVLAKRIIGLAQQGITDPHELSNRALSDLGVPP